MDTETLDREFQRIQQEFVKELDDVRKLQKETEAAARGFADTTSVLKKIFGTTETLGVRCREELQRPLDAHRKELASVEDSLSNGSHVDLRF